MLIGKSPCPAGYYIAWVKTFHENLIILANHFSLSLFTRPCYTSTSLFPSYCVWLTWLKISAQIGRTASTAAHAEAAFKAAHNRCDHCSWPYMGFQDVYARPAVHAIQSWHGERGTGLLQNEFGWTGQNVGNVAPYWMSSLSLWNLAIEVVFTVGCLAPTFLRSFSNVDCSTLIHYTIHHRKVRRLTSFGMFTSAPFSTRMTIFSFQSDSNLAAKCRAVNPSWQRRKETQHSTEMSNSQLIVQKLWSCPLSIHLEGIPFVIH